MSDQATLVAMLGGQPQVVTFTLDLLLARGEEVNQVVVVYPGSNPRCQAAYQHLAGEFPGDFYTHARCPCHLRREPIQRMNHPLDDIQRGDEVEVARRKIHDLLSDLKDQGHTIHLSLSGGRRVMSLVALAAAMQYLTHADKIWHIFTEDDFIKEAAGGAIMHAPPDSNPVQLVEVPFVPWVAYFPGLKGLLSRSPRELMEAGWMEDDERERCAKVWAKLPLRQRDALRAFARGLVRKQAAAELGIDITTVDTHRDAIARLCRQVWDTYDGVFDIHFLHEHFGPYLRGIGEI